MQEKETADPNEETARQLKDLPKDPELRVPVPRLRKAKTILDTCEKEAPTNIWPEVKNAKLLHCLARACPSWMANREEKSSTEERQARWYAGAHRDRGSSLPEGHDGPASVLLFAPRRSRFPNKGHVGMPHISSNIVFSLTDLPALAVQSLVIVSDSTLQMPAVIYGLQGKARYSQNQHLCLRWMAVCPGAGAAELAGAWRKSPPCDYGLTVVNMNDCVKDDTYNFTEANTEDLQKLVQTASTHCRLRSDLFINNHAFYPRLRRQYAQLWRLYTQAAQKSGATVHNGERFIPSIELRDQMHFAEKSSTAVVDRGGDDGGANRTNGRSSFRGGANRTSGGSSCS